MSLCTLGQLRTFLVSLGHLWKSYPNTHPPGDVIVVQPREFHVKKPRDHCLQEPLWSWSAPARWVPDRCLFITTFVTRNESSSWTLTSQHREKMLWITWVCLISSYVRKSQLCANSEPDLLQDLLPRHGCSPFFWDNQFHSTLLSTVIPKKGARLRKCDLISAPIIPFTILSLIFQNIVSSLRGFFHCEIQGWFGFFFYFISLFLWMRDFWTVSKIIDKWIYKIMEWPDKELLINLQSLFTLFIWTNFYEKAEWRGTGILKKALFSKKPWLEWIKWQCCLHFLQSFL